MAEEVPGDYMFRFWLHGDRDLAAQQVDAILADVFQGKKDHLRTQLMHVMAKAERAYVQAEIDNPKGRYSTAEMGYQERRDAVTLEDAADAYDAEGTSVPAIWLQKRAQALREAGERKKRPPEEVPTDG